MAIHFIFDAFKEISDPSRVCHTDSEPAVLDVRSNGSALMCVSARVSQALVNQRPTMSMMIIIDVRLGGQIGLESLILMMPLMLRDTSVNNNNTKMIEAGEEDEQGEEEEEQ